MIDYMATFMEKIIENPACINWDYFLKNGVTEPPSIDSNNVLKKYIPEDSELYYNLKDVVTQVLQGAQIEYDFIIDVILKIMWATKCDLDSFDKYMVWSKRLYSSDNPIKPGPYPNAYGYNLSDLDLSIKSYNCLKRAGYKTIKDVAKDIDTEQFINIEGLNDKCIKEINTALKRWTQFNLNQRLELQNKLKKKGIEVPMDKICLESNEEIDCPTKDE